MKVWINKTHHVVSKKFMGRSFRIMDDIRMIAWIDEYGDVVWNDKAHKTYWTGFLQDGCRLDPYEDNDERINGLWMILE